MYLSHYTFLFFLALSWCACQATEEKSTDPPEVKSSSPSTAFALQAGDLLFQDDQSNPRYIGIEKANQGVNGAQLSRVGMVQAKDSDFIVWEVTDAGVSETPLATFLERSIDAQQQPKVLVGRLKPEYQKWIPDAFKAAYDYRGTPSDPVFWLDDQQLYGAEFIYFIFKKANEDQPVFRLQPLNFRQRKSGKAIPEWENYFKNLGKFIPQGTPGIDPGSISRSLYLEIVHVYGQLEGWKSK